VGGVPSTIAFRNTTGPATALTLSIKDGVGASLYANCNDVALVAVGVVDAAGRIVTGSSAPVTFTVTGPGYVAGTANGDPSCHTLNTSPVRPAFHGQVR